MKILIHKIHIFTTDGEENIFSFSDTLTFIYGNVGTGKSTLLDLIMYSLGGNLTYTPAVSKCFEAVQLDVMLEGRPFCFFRRVKSNRIQADDIIRNQRHSLLSSQISTFIYAQSSLPDLHLSIGNIKDRKVKLSFINFSWFSYLKQSEMDNSFFHLDSDSIFRQTAAINVLFSFLGSEFLFDRGVSQEYRELKKRLRQYEDGEKVFGYLEKIFTMYNTADGIDEGESISELKNQMDRILSRPEHLERNDVLHLLDQQRKLDCLEYKMAFEMRRERYYKEIDHLREEMERTSRHIYYDKSLKNPNVQELYALFLDCLLNIGFHGVTKFDTVRMDPVSYMPIISNPYERRDVSFENLGSGGKKTLFKICFALAIHRLQHAKQKFNYLPSFLIIDTPMKNISEREDVQMYDRFYRYLFSLFSTELSDTQLFVVDKEKRNLEDYEFCNQVAVMRMTHGEEMNPPLFKNYRGL